MTVISKQIFCLHAANEVSRWLAATRDNNEHTGTQVNTRQFRKCVYPQKQHADGPDGEGN